MSRLNSRKPLKPLVRLRVHPGVTVTAAAASARLSAAERRSVGHDEINRRALVFGLAELARCGTCVASLPCERHGAEAQREAEDLIVRLAGMEPDPQPEEKKTDPKEKAVGFAEVVRVYFDAFKAARGAEPPFDAKEGKAARTLIQRLGSADKVCALLRSVYAPGSWWADKATIISISKDPAQHVRKPGAGGSSTAQRPAAETEQAWSKGKEIEV